MIEIIRHGSQATIVDMGRYNLRRYGVPISGAMDRTSAFRANSLLSNSLNAALLELYQPGHELFFHQRTMIALAGSEADIYLDDKRIYSDHIYKINKNTRLSIGRMTRGCRIYLAVRGGICSQAILGSRSPIPGFLNRHLYKGDKIPITTYTAIPELTSSIAPIDIQISKALTCYIGPEWNNLTSSSRQHLLTQEYTIDPKSDRMGYRIKGNPLQNNIDEIYSSPVMPGTVQLLPSGLPLILMRECQTTGGYPRILQLTEDGINQAAQRKPGDPIQFQLIH